MKGLHGGIPLTVLAAVARAQVMGGPSGNDGGQSTAIPIQQVYEHRVSDWSKDDHSVHIEHDRPSFPPFGAPHGGARSHQEDSASEVIPSTSSQPNVARGFPHRHPPPNVIGGPSGNDVGNNFVAPISGFYSSEFNNWDQDDHSVEVEHGRGPPPFHPHNGGFERRADHPGDDATVIGGPSGDDTGNNFVAPITGVSSTEFNNWNKDDHSIEIEHENMHHSFARRGEAPGGDATVIGGPSGDDVGNNAAVPITGIYSTELNNWNEDDHSIEIEHENKHHGFHRRADGPGDDATIIGGPSGDDVGNNAAVPITDIHSTEFNNWNKDDHSIEIEHENKHHGFHRRADGPGDDATIIGGPSGDDIGNNAAVPITGIHSTELNNWNKDDHSIEIEHENMHHGPHGGFERRADGVDAGDSLIGGPSGDDIGNNAAIPITGIYSNKESNYKEDDHSVTVTTAHDNPLVEVPADDPQPQKHNAAVSSQEVKSHGACSHATINVVHTVTETVFRPVHATAKCQQQQSSQIPVQVPTPSPSRKMVAQQPSSYSMVSVEVPSPAPTSVFGVVEASTPASSVAFASPSPSGVSPSQFGGASSASGHPSSSSSYIPYTGGASRLSSTAGVASVVCGFIAVLAVTL